MVLESSGKLHSKFILDHSTVSWDTPIQHPWRPQRLASMESDHSIWCVPFLRWRADDRRSTGSQTRWGRASDPWAAAALMTALRTPFQACFADQSAVDADDQHLPWSDESWDSQCKRTGTACMSCSGPLNSKASPTDINTFSRLAMAPLLKQPLKAVITAPQIPRARWTCCFWLKWSLHWKLSRLMPSEGTYQKYCKILDCVGCGRVDAGLNESFLDSWGSLQLEMNLRLNFENWFRRTAYQELMRKNKVMKNCIYR